MRVLITGGTGTISSGIVQECVKRGYETYAITRGRNSRRNVSGAKYLSADVWNKAEVQNIIKDLYFDVVVECLVYSVKQLELSLENYVERCNQYVFVSTAAVYGEKNHRITELDSKECEWSYSTKKMECERYIEEFFQNKENVYTIIRPTVTYGNYRIPFPIATRDPGWTFFQRLLDGKPMLACKDVRFSVMHIDDFSRYVVSLFNNEKAYNEDFNITSNLNEINWDEVIQKAGQILNVKPIVIHVPLPVFQRVYNNIYDELKYHKNIQQVFDDKKLMNAISDDNIPISLEEGLKTTIVAMRDEYKNNRLVLDENWNNLCDETIYYAYVKKLLVSDECEKYIKKLESMSFKQITGLRFSLLKRLFKKTIKQCLGK